MVRGIANSKIGFGDLILLLRYFFKLKVSTHPSISAKSISKNIRETTSLIFQPIEIIRLSYISRPHIFYLIPILPISVYMSLKICLLQSAPPLKHLMEVLPVFDSQQYPDPLQKFVH